MDIKFRPTTGTGESIITVNAAGNVSLSELRQHNSIKKYAPLNKEAQFVYKDRILNNSDTPQSIEYKENDVISIVFVNIPKTITEQTKKFLHVSQRLKNNPNDIQKITFPKGSTMDDVQKIVLHHYNSNVVLEDAPKKPRINPTVPVRFFKCENLDAYSSSSILSIREFEECSGTITFYFEGETIPTGGGSYHNYRRLSTTSKSSSSRRRRSAKKRGTQRKQKRRQRRASRRAY